MTSYDDKSAVGVAGDRQAEARMLSALCARANLARRSTVGSRDPSDVQRLSVPTDRRLLAMR